MSSTAPCSSSPCQFSPARFRTLSTPMMPLPPNYLLVHCLCPCGRHRIHFAVHRSVLLARIGRNQSITQNAPGLSDLQRQAEILLQARIRRLMSRRETMETPYIDSDCEDVDR